MFLVLWEYDVHPEHHDAFVTLYRPDGEWNALFRGGAGYVGTALMRDSREPMRYLVSDRWASEQAWESFLREHATAYAELSERGARFYRTEIQVGRFHFVE